LRRAALKKFFDSPLTEDYFLFLQIWFPTVQDVLQADWQDAWHSPQPPETTVFERAFFTTTFICFIKISNLLF